MNIQEAFENAFVRMQAKKWDHIYILVDIHGTVFKPSYHNKENYEFYPYAKECLKMFKTEFKDTIKLIMWTSSTKEQIDEFNRVFKENGIEFDFVNENPDVQALPTDPKSSDFSSKYYFNIGLDDKFGFDPNNDWGDIIKYFYYKFRP